MFVRPHRRWVVCRRVSSSLQCNADALRSDSTALGQHRCSPSAVERLHCTVGCLTRRAGVGVGVAPLLLTPQVETGPPATDRRGAAHTGREPARSVRTIQAPMGLRWYVRDGAGMSSTLSGLCMNVVQRSRVLVFGPVSGLRGMTCAESSVRLIRPRHAVRGKWFQFC